MVAAADRVLLVADASKLGVAQLGRVAALDEVDELITDARGGAAANGASVDDPARASLAALADTGLAITAVPVGAGLG
jgi:DeoR family transcriptional regulator of aga operon